MSRVKDVKRIVVKIGTSTLTHSSGHLNLKSIEYLVRQIADIHNKGIEVVLVTSGAIGAGIGALGYEERPKTMPEKQACAAVGQVVLLHMYQKLFSEYGKTTAQILLTRDDMKERKRFLNSRNTFFKLFELGAIPIVNENDAVVVDEIKFGDNDTLSAMVASLVEADLLIILSDIDGLYDSNPSKNKDAKLISYVNSITREIEDMAGDAGSKLGTGGMTSKLKAGKISSASGIPMLILNGKSDKILLRALEGEEVGTYFKGSTKKLKGRKHWLAYETLPKGKICVDKGAEEALFNNKSLLPKGVLSVEGIFEQGDIVQIVNEDFKKIAHGICNYSSRDINKIKGVDSTKVETILGFKHYDEIIHIDNMVIL